MCAVYGKGRVHFFVEGGCVAPRRKKQQQVYHTPELGSQLRRNYSKKRTVQYWCSAPQRYQFFERGMEQEQLDKDFPVKELLSQGAEARVWKIPYSAGDGNAGNSFAILKERFSKKYRHPSLDERLTKQRCKKEGRLLEKCAKSSTHVPKVYRVQPPYLILEYLKDYQTVREYLLKQQSANKDDGDIPGSLLALATSMGSAIARLHSNGTVHGDLTTSNMMIQKAQAPTFEIYLIDFGLGKNTTSVEERAVDLYVLERALTSTHPHMADFLWTHVLQAYEQYNHTEGESNKKTTADIKATLVRLEQVRQRGRKRECFG